jgi:hypothetical protein
MAEEELNRFVLVGGTALALQFGHRESVDVDLFGKQPLDTLDLSGILSGFGKVQLLKKSPSIEVYSVDSIKVDFVNYRYPLLRPIIEESRLRLASPEDIAAMKLSAIAGRGSKKDFIDLYLLLQHFSLKEIVNFYLKKFPDGSEFLVLKSLTYFDDAEKEAAPKMFMNVTWQEIKECIREEVNKL